MTTVYKNIDSVILEEIYIALKDAGERLTHGTNLIDRCTDYLEREQGCGKEVNK
jgi:hypothetical protein